MRRAVALGGNVAELEPVPGFAAAPVTQDAAHRLDLDARQHLFEPERVQHARAVRADLNPGADFLELVGLLVELDIDAALEQSERRRKTADAAADDDDLAR